MRGRGLAAVAAFIVGIPALALADAAAPQASATPEQPFPPSYITLEGGKAAKVDDWQDPAMCVGCHPRQAAGWQGSMHSIAFTDPVFQNLWALGDKATKGETFNHCGACHTGLGIATGTVKFDPDKPVHGEFTAPGVAAKGVSCDLCHTISATNVLKTATLEHGNASYELSPGPVKRGPLQDSKSPFHETAYSELHTKSAFCGNCHNIFHPTNHFPVERTYDEWKYSIYAQHGIQCQDCHMTPVKTAIKVADTLKPAKELGDQELGGAAGLGGPTDRSVVHEHGFVGGNALIAPLLKVQGGEEHKAIAVERLQNAAELEVYVEQLKDNLHQLKVKVINARAGHHLPTSLTEVRQLWLEAIVTDNKGRELVRSGTLTPENELPPDTVAFNSHAVDKDGKDTVLPWEVARFVDSPTIPPKGYKYAKYPFNVPADAGKLKVVAKLHYRSYPQGVADIILGKGAVTIPSFEMESVTKEFSVSKGKVASAK